MVPTRVDDEMLAVYRRVDNTGRWGNDDELGTLNHISPRKRREAAGLVRAGRVVSLAHPLVATDAQGETGQIERRMFYNRELDGPGPLFAGDHFAMDTHQQDVTHLDCLSHIGSHDGRAYNGRRFEEVTGDQGLAFGSIAAQKQGIFTRGVLLDVAAAYGSDWLAPTHEITSACLDRAEDFAGVEVEPGDAVVVRAGLAARERSEGPGALLAGPGPDAAEWLHARGVALYTGDAPEHITPVAAVVLGRLDPSDVDPTELSERRFPLPFHQIAIPAMGLVLLDHAEVEELAATCRELGRSEFLFVVAPLVMPGGSGSPVNPLAVF